jgi:hypothetical protein
VILGGGAHKLEVAVKVEPLAGLGELPEHAGIAP